MPQPRDFDVRVEGLAPLRKKLRETDRAAGRELQSTIKEAVEVAAHAASELAPRRTGTLARSYRPFTRGNIAGVRSPLPYAPVIEYGGSISPKGSPIQIRRYEPVRRAIDQERTVIEARLASGFDALARRNGWR